MSADIETGAVARWSVVARQADSRRHPDTRTDCRSAELASRQILARARDGATAGGESASNSDLPVPCSRYVLAESAPFLVTSMLFLLQVNMTVWIVATLCSGSDLAVFGAAHRLMNAVLLPLVLVSAVVPPAIVELHTRSEREGLQRLLRATATAAGLPAAAALALLAVGSHWFLGTIFGAFYAEGARLLWIISAGQVLFLAVLPPRCWR